MVEKYLETTFKNAGIPFEKTQNGLEFNCGGNRSEFERVISYIYKNYEKWTYDLEIDIKIEIRTGFEKVVISL